MPSLQAGIRVHLVFHDKWDESLFLNGDSIFTTRTGLHVRQGSSVRSFTLASLQRFSVTDRKETVN